MHIKQNGVAERKTQGRIKRCRKTQERGYTAKRKTMSHTEQNAYTAKRCRRTQENNGKQPSQKGDIPGIRAPPFIIISPQGDPPNFLKVYSTTLEDPQEFSRIVEDPRKSLGILEEIMTFS